MTSDILSDVLAYALAATLLPLISFFTSLLIPARYSWLVSLKANGLLLGSLFCALKTAQLAWPSDGIVFATSWFSIGGHQLDAALELSRPSLVMLVVVAVISFLVHIYSSGYMAEDRGIQRYFAMLGFFTFSMQGLVLADNLLQLFFFWELVGFSSYMLIGHWMENPAAGQAAKKAFIMNRIGDLGFIVGMMIIWTHSGTFSISDLLASAPFEWQTVGALCIFFAVAGKSAQFPLFTWLPDAMAGPTPVSALIHAATMVAAGVYLLVRLAPVFTPDSLIVVSGTGLLTAVLGAIAALRAFDLKRILAYSTMSQLGLMVMALGMGAVGAAFAHLVAHAFFKACLFLSAGSVIHGVHRAQLRSQLNVEAQDIRNMGGLKEMLPVTFVTFSIGAASLAGLPLFSGFLSKEAMLLSIIGSTDSASWLMGAGLLLVSMLTAVYAFRMVWMVFMGSPRHQIAAFVTQAPGVMRLPALALAMASFWFTISWNPFIADGWLLGNPGQANPGLTLISAGWVCLAMLVGYFLYHKGTFSPRPSVNDVYFVDRFYQRSFGKIVNLGASVVAYTDRRWIDGFVHALAYFHVTFSHVAAWFDKAVVDGVVNAAARTAALAGAVVRSFQGGKIQLYIFWAILATIIFLIWMLD